MQGSRRGSVRRMPIFSSSCKANVTRASYWSPHPEQDAGAGLEVGLRQLAVVEQLLLQPLQLHAGG